jgi:hypothetical protein
MSHVCSLPISSLQPTTLNHHYDNVTLLLEHIKAVLDIIWLTDQGESSPSTVASLGGNLCEELERRLDGFYQFAREQEHRLTQLSATSPADSHAE